MAVTRARKRLCVFCGASLGARPEYAEAAENLGRLMAKAQWGLVYGGTSIGLMGRIADAVLAGGGEAIGVLPSSLVEKGIAHPDLNDLLIVDSLAERKQRMFDLSGAFAALPGGFGTLDELSEMLAWAQLGYHQKPVALLNTGGYFDALLDFLRHAAGEGLLRESHLALLGIADDPETLLRLVSGGTTP
ncbi:MAG: TIGR00730 family Rossman fold protein [SAR324 cluster bacterium]|nr:TIGR00730 family Rossman fold protein [SAR324 cluster bacterium]MCH8887613.1 TIGR00730 family Rossman fold protein [SAR324 cluster bacterium]